VNQFSDFAFLASMFSPIAALLAIPLVFVIYRTQVGVEALLGFIWLAASSIGIALLTGFGGMVAGGAGFCIYEPGAQCAFGGIFISGPLGFSLGVAVVLYWWARRMKQSNLPLEPDGETG
jgi:hypothetical protein